MKYSTKVQRLSNLQAERAVKWKDTAELIAAHSSLLGTYQEIGNWKKTRQTLADIARVLTRRKKFLERLDERIERLNGEVTEGEKSVR